MAFFDIFKSKKDQKANENNSLYGQTQLGNQLLRQTQDGKGGAAFQLLYVSTSSTNVAGRIVDTTMLTRNSTIMSCVGVMARAISQCDIYIAYKTDDGTFENVLNSDKAGNRDKAKAKQVLSLLNEPNNFQCRYEFWYQWAMWYMLTGETFTLLFRKDQKDAMQTPIEMYNLDSTLITTQLNPARYPTYKVSTPSYGFNRDEPLDAHQIIHISEAPWQGSAGFNKGILAAELVSLDQDIDIYSNHVMQNGAKPSGMFVTDQVIPDAKYREIAARLKEAWASMTGSRPTDLSKPGQSIMLDNGMKYQPLNMLTLQDADAANLKAQTTKRICALFGVPPQMLGLEAGKFNNTQTLLDEFYKTSVYPVLVQIEQKFKMSLLKGYPNLYIRFSTNDFLKGAALDQINFVNAAVSGGVMTPNEGREYLNMPKMAGADSLVDNAKPSEPTPGSSAQDTGGGGGNQKKKANIGKT